MAEVQALLDDHVAGGKHSAADVVAKAQGILSEPELLRAMFDVGYFPPKVLAGTGHSQIQNWPLDPFLFRSTFHCHAFT
jgi:hypothetical protein